MASDEVFRILVGLDELFDVRLSTLLEMDETYPEIALANGYLTRNSDDFGKLIPNFDLTRYNELYDKRNILHLANTRITNLIYLLNGVYKKADECLQEKPFAFKKELWVNIYPYVLTEDLKHIASSALEMHLDVKIHIEFIDKRIEDLTPTFIKNNFQNVVLYEFNKWMVAHESALIANPMPTVSMTVPNLSLPGKAEKAVLKEINSYQIPATSLVQLNYVQHVAIEFDDIMTFCINVPLNTTDTTA